MEQTVTAAAPDQDQELSNKITSLVEERLQAAQKHKEYKDEGRKDGTRKGRIAYQIISLQNLSDIEKDPILAEKQTTKLKVWPEVNIEEEKASGTTSGACYLKYQYHRALAPKPFNTAESRKIYITVLTTFQELLKAAKGAKEVEETAYQVFSDKGLQLIYPEIVNAEYKTKDKREYRYYTSGKIKLIAESIFGKSFMNLVRKSYGSQAVQQKFFNAVLYDPFTQDEADKILAMRKEYKAKAVAEKQAEIEKFRVSSDSRAIFAEMVYYGLYYGKNKSEFDKINLEDNKKILVEYLQNRLTRYINTEISIPPQYQARGESWAWAYEKKEKSRKTKSEMPRINTGPYASRLVRKNGIKVAQIGTKGVKQTWGLTAVQYGNGLNDKESEVLTYFLNGAFQDLAECLNINLQRVNTLGSLGLDFATRGTAGSSAQYWPDYKVINLNKRNGDGSLAHEWGHFLDNFLSIEVAAHEQEKLNGHFGSLATRHRAADPEIEQLLRGLMKFIQNGNGTETIKKKITRSKSEKIKYIEDKGSFDATLNYYTDRYKSYINDIQRFEQNLNAYNLFADVAEKFNVDSFELEIKLNSSYQYYYSSKCGNKKYWCSNVELFARAFEMYVTTKLNEKAMQNNFLQADRNYWRKLYNVFPYPAEGTERETTNNYFETLFNLLRAKYDLQPLPNAFAGERVIEDLANSTLSAKSNDLEESPEEEQDEETQEEKQEEVLEVIQEEKQSTEEIEQDNKVEAQPEFKRGDIIKQDGAPNYQLITNVKNGEYTIAFLDENLKPVAVSPLSGIVKFNNPVLTDKKLQPNHVALLDGEFTIQQIAELTGFKYQTVKKVDYKLTPGNEGLAKIVKPFTGSDELRPVMSAFNFDEYGVTATNAHLLIHIAGKPTKQGLFNSDGTKFKFPEGANEAKYPNYRAVVPMRNQNIFKVDAQELYNYCYLIEKSKIDTSKHRVVMAYVADGEVLQVGADFHLLKMTVKALLQISDNNDWYAQLSKPNRAIVFTNHNKTVSPEDDSYTLLMPVMVGSDIPFGVEYNEYNAEKRAEAHWDFKANAVIQNGKKIDLKTLTETDHIPEAGKMIPATTTAELIEALKLTYEINPDEQTKELIEALELTETI